MLNFLKTFFSVEEILSTFKNQFWFDHNWSIGIHGKYLYTLPFHFDVFTDFIDFDHIQSNNPTIFNCFGIWSHIKSIEFSLSSLLNVSLIKQIKIKMPKLISITLYENNLNSIQLIEEPYQSDVTLDSVTTLHLHTKDLENAKQWFLYILPNLKYLTLSDTKLPLVKSELTSILDKKIQKMNIYDIDFIRSITKLDYVCFSNLQKVYLKLVVHKYNFDDYKWYADNITELLKYLQNLKTLWICLASSTYFNASWAPDPAMVLDNILSSLEINEVQKNYQITCVGQYAILSKINFQT